MQEAVANAKESAEKITEKFGIEGVKSERALHTRLTGAFTAITKSGNISAESIGESFESLSEGLKLSMGAMGAMLVASVFIKIGYAAYETANKIKEAFKDALDVKSEGTAKSVEGVQKQVEALKKDADALNVQSMGSIQIGAEAIAQAFMEGKSIAEVAKENATEFAEILKEAQSEEAAAATKKLEDETALIVLRREGKDKDAEELEKQQKAQDDINKLLDQQAALQKALDTGITADKKPLIDRDGATKEIAGIQDQLDALNMPQAVKNPDSEKQVELINQYLALQKEGAEAGMTAEQKLAVAKMETADAQAKVNSTGQFTLENEKALLELQKDINKQKELQAQVDKEAKEKQNKLDTIATNSQEETEKQADIKKYAGLDPEQAKVAEETDKYLRDQAALQKSTSTDVVKKAEQALALEKQKTSLIEEQAKLSTDLKQAQQDAADAKINASMFHGETSSLAKLGLGGRVSGANYGNQSQEKAAIDSAKHLADIKAEMKKLSGAIGVTGS